jgi:hypothetical protein
MILCVKTVCDSSCSQYIFLDDLFKVHKAKPTLKWRQSFESYLKTMPPYYLGVRILLFKQISFPPLLGGQTQGFMLPGKNSTIELHT